MKTKLWGLPRWGWLGLGVGAVALFFYIRHRNALAAAAPAAPAATDALAAPALGGTPDTSSLPPDSGGGGAIPDQKLADAIQNAIAQAYHQSIDALNAGGVLGAGLGPDLAGGGGYGSGSKELNQTTIATSPTLGRAIHAPRSSPAPRHVPRPRHAHRRRSRPRARARARPY